MSVLLPQLGIDAAELEHLGFKRASVSGSGPDHPATVAVDLDGTLAKHFDTYDPKSIPDPRPGAKRALKKWRDAGYRIIIWTVRGNEKLVKNWLKKHEVPFDYINQNPNQPEDASQKVIADVYVDDRGVDGTQAWDKLYQQVTPQLEKASSYKISANSHFLRAFRQTPIAYNRQRSILQNISDYLRGVYQQGRHNIQLARTDDAIGMNMQPESVQWDRLRATLRGNDPVITNPVDRIVEQI